MTTPSGGTNEEPAQERAAGGASPQRQRLVILASAIVIGVLGIVLAFFVGSRLAGGDTPAPAPSPTASPSATATSTPTPTPVPVSGPATPGPNDWAALAGGECLDPFGSPWDETFTVVDCGEPHRAQLVLRGSFGDDPAAAYPGEQALTSQLNLLCSAPTALDYGAAAAYTDVQIQASYPATAELWAAGDRSYYCFATLAGGGALNGSIAVTTAG